MNEIYLIAGMMAVTFFTRYALVPLSGKMAFSKRLERVLSYVPPAVLSAIIVPSVVIPDGANMNLTLNNAYLVGAVITCLAGWLTKNLLATIVLGMTGFLLYQWMLMG